MDGLAGIQLVESRTDASETLDGTLTLTGEALSVVTRTRQPYKKAIFYVAEYVDDICHMRYGHSMPRNDVMRFRDI